MSERCSEHGLLGCAICENRRAFDMPEEVVEAARNGSLVLFVGAGVSTESSTVLRSRLYDTVASDLGAAFDRGMAFSQLMSRYCALPNGRLKLIKMIKERFEYIRKFPELYRAATRFHREIATIPQIRDIITTNWDDLFERECGALPVVTPADFALMDVPGRRVFKIHGSINNCGSIVATDEDYQRCYDDHGIVGSHLRTVLATKTVVFVGYSFADQDLQRIYALISGEMGSLARHIFVVTLDASVSDKMSGLPVTPILTDGTYFAEKLKQRLVEEGEMLPDSRYDALVKALRAMRVAHNKLHRHYDCHEYPAVIYASHYQDGVLHAFEYLLEQRNTGESSDGERLVRVIASYSVILKEKRQRRVYHDVAYIDGYMNGLIAFVSRETQCLPRFYILGGPEVPRWDDFVEEVGRAADYHKAGSRYARKIVDKLAPGIIPHHTPVL